MSIGEYVTLTARDKNGKASTRIGIVIGPSFYADHIVVQWDVLAQPVHTALSKLIKVG